VNATLYTNLKTKTFCTKKQILAKNGVLFNKYGCPTTQPCADEEIMGHVFKSGCNNSNKGT